MSDRGRRTFMSSALALTVAPLACSAPPSTAHGHGRKAAPGVLQPGSAWTGKAGSGGTPPPQSDKPFGTLVPDERFTGNFSAIPGQWIHQSGTRITALGLPPQPAESGELNYFKEAVFYLEGNSVTVTEWSVNPTPVAMPDGTMAPQGSIGFSVEIGAGEGAVTAGDAILYCYLRGEHGLERRIELPIVINIDGALNDTRDVRYVDPVVGDDSASGTKAAPWRTLFRALGSGGVKDGGLVLLAREGAYVEDRNETSDIRNRDVTRAIEVMPAKGLRGDRVIITRTDRLKPELRWRVKARVVHFHGLTVDLSKIAIISGPDRAVIGFSGCRVVDGRGPNGPRDAAGFDLGINLSSGPPSTWDGADSSFYMANCGVYFAECLVINYVLQGARLYRNVTGLESTDAFAGGVGYDNVVVDGYFVTMLRDGITRSHSAPHLVIASARKGPDGTTILALEDPSDLRRSGKSWDNCVMFVSGTLAGKNMVQIEAAEPETKTLIVRGDFADQIVPGDRIRCYRVWHSDFCQHMRPWQPDQTGMHNTVIFRYRASSPASQLFLTQSDFPLEPGTTLSSEGRTFRLVNATGKPSIVVGDDLLQVRAGPQSGEYRIVESYDRATGTGRLMDPFSADQKGVAVVRSKALTGFVMALSILRKTGTAEAIGQFQHGHRNFVLAQNSFFAQPHCLLFCNNTPAHGHRNHVQVFNLMSALDSDPPGMPRWGLRLERNHFLRGGARGREGRVADAKLNFGPDNRYQPFREQLRIGRKPLIPFDSFGNPVDENSPVGAIAV